MKRYVSFLLVLTLLILTLCACENNPNRATCTISATNGFTGVYCAYECLGDVSSTWLATSNPIIATFDEPGTLDYEFTCPACEYFAEGTLTPADSIFLRCDCENKPQAIVISATFSEVYDSGETPQYEREP